MESLSGEVEVQDDAPSRDDDTLAEAQSPSSPAVGRYIGSPFWSSLTTEVQALREALEDEHPEDDEPTSPTLNGHGNATEYDLLICPPGAVYVMPGALAEPSPQLSAALCNTFCSYVDRM